MDDIYKDDEDKEKMEKMHEIDRVEELETRRELTKQKYAVYSAVKALPIAQQARYVEDENSDSS